MTEGLAAVATTTLERLRDALRAEQLRAPFTRGDLSAYGMREQLDALSAALSGHSRNACVAILDAVLAERAKYDLPTPELVWTGPEGMNALARDTAVVLRELFESAQERVVLAGYSFRNAESVLAPLSTAMRERGVRTSFFVDVEQASSFIADPDSRGQAALARFLADNWPFGAPYPELYCDRRALQPGPPWCSLHAKCLAVDGARAFVSSANFTIRGQERNIEAGVLLHDPHFAGQLERQWLSLIEGGFVLQYRACGGA
jgi:phosphatidylserine/phosphatidylglycerophosphate/cardiolipin synthase-like enzyme